MSYDPNNSVLIMGTGAMACLFAARLSAADVPVFMYGTWPEGRHALQTAGVRLVSETGEEHAYPVQVISQPVDCPGSRYALVLVKSWQTQRAARQLADCLAPNGMALTLQNGVGNREALSKALGAKRTSLGVTTIGATLLGPGRVREAGAARRKEIEPRNGEDDRHAETQGGSEAGARFHAVDPNRQDPAAVPANSRAPGAHSLRHLLNGHPVRTIVVGLPPAIGGGGERGPVPRPHLVDKRVPGLALSGPFLVVVPAGGFLDGLDERPRRPRTSSGRRSRRRRRGPRPSRRAAAAGPAPGRPSRRSCSSGGRTRWCSGRPSTATGACVRKGPRRCRARLRPAPVAASMPEWPAKTTFAPVQQSP